MRSTEIKEKIIELLKDNTLELSSPEIQKKLKLNRTTITKYLAINAPLRRHKLWNKTNITCTSEFPDTLCRGPDK